MTPTPSEMFFVRLTIEYFWKVSYLSIGVVFCCIGQTNKQSKLTNNNVFHKLSRQAPPLQVVYKP